MKLLSACLSVLLLLPLQVQAWSNHSLGSSLALAPLPGMAAETLRVESLERFLEAEEEGLRVLLDEQERFARAQFEEYPSRPDELRWQAGAADRRSAFLQALRINPETRLALFIQAVPGVAPGQRERLDAGAVTVYRKLSLWSEWRFFKVGDGELLSPLAVLSSAADEPDYGHDINLFSDNPGTAGARYNFGTQPFGDARFEYSSQAPFHIGYYHEDPLVFAAGPFLRRTYPQWRSYQYIGLARFAFERGHPYWGYRFLGWGLHYIQDMTQPYHASVLPGSTTTGLLWTAAKALGGFPADKQAAMARVATRHTEVEKYQLQWLRGEMASGDSQRSLLKAYAEAANDGRYPPFDYRYLRDTVALESHQRADQFDGLIGQWLEQQPAVGDFRQGNQLTAARPDAQLQQLIIELIGHFGAHTRNAVRATAPR